MLLIPFPEMDALNICGARPLDRLHKNQTIHQFKELVSIPLMIIFYWVNNCKFNIRFHKS
jgi:hypothetical protein